MDTGGSPGKAQRIVIVSDLHVGISPQSGSSVGDSAFRRLIGRLIRDADLVSAELRLVLLGDTFDFPGTQTMNGHVRDSDEDLVRRLDFVLNSHPEIVQALREVLAAGHRLDILPGNHDPGLMRPAVQEKLRAALSTAPTPTLQFHPWILYIPDILYAEHGNQYHDINSFPAWLRAQDIELSTWRTPVGARLDEFVQVLRADPGTAHVSGRHSTSGTLGDRIRDPRQLPRTMRLVAGFGIGVLREAAAVNSRSRRRQRNQYRSQMLERAATASGLPVAILTQIDKIAERNAQSWTRRLRSSTAASIRSRFGHNRGASGSGAIVAMTEAERRGHFRSMAAEIGTVLAAGGCPTAVCAFGHTHLADLATMPETTAVNAGSWLADAPHHEPDLVSQPILPFVQVDYGQSAQPPSVACLAWLDHLQETGKYPIS